MTLNDLFSNEKLFMPLYWTIEGAVIALSGDLYAEIIIAFCLEVSFLFPHATNSSPTSKSGEPTPSATLKPYLIA